MTNKRFTSLCVLLVLLGTLESGAVAFGQAASCGNEVVAVVDGTAITQEQVDAAAGTAVFALQEKLYNLRKSALDNLIVEAALNTNAKKHDISVAELKKSFMPAQVEVAQEEVDAAYQENRDALAQMNADEARQRIRLDLESRVKLEQYKRAVAAILAKASVDRRLRAPQPPPSLLGTAGPRRGERNAPVTIVEYSDFECPYCRNAAGDVTKLLTKYGTSVALVYKHMPLPNHPNSFKAAQASVCAGEQNRFWEYHDRLFASDDLTAEALKQYASELGLQSEKFNACMAASRSATIVRRDMSEALQAGVQGTPTFFVNGRAVRSTKGFSEIQMAIDEALKHTADTPGNSATVQHGQP
jgi:protein-disulfide isomerase